MNNVFNKLIEDEMTAYFDGEYMDHSTVRERLEALVNAVISESTQGTQT